MPAQLGTAGGAAGAQARGDAAGQQRQLQRIVSRYALRGGLAAAAIGTVIALALNWNRSLTPLVGDLTAFGVLAALVSSVLVLVTAGYAYVVGLRFRNARLPANRRHVWWVGVAPVALGAAVETLLVVGVGVLLGNVVFKELALVSPIASLIVGVAAAVSVYLFMGRLLLTGERSILQIVMALLVLGILVAAAGEQNSKWWEESFSYLGTAESNTRLIFNISFVLTGLLIVVWQQFYVENITILVEHGSVKPRVHTVFKVGLIVVGILVMLIGILHWGASPVISLVHDLSAYSAGGLITLAMLGIYWLIPGFSREFYAANYVLAAVMIGAVLMLFLGIFNTVGVELTYFTIVGVWLLLLMDATEMLVEETDPAAYQP